MIDKILTDLNLNQRDAVETTEGPLLIIAGPGSGKTRVVTHRIAYLVKSCGVMPYRIAAVTFTNKAAREMTKRLADLECDDITIGTFHAFCSKILRRDGSVIGLDSNFVIYDDTDQVALIKSSMKDVEIDPKQYAPRAIQASISNAKSQLLDPEEFSRNIKNYYDEIVLRVYEQYSHRLSKSSAVDFDDLLFKACTLFKQFPEIANKYQNRFMHFMVDEFQDTNVAQYSIAKQMSQKHHNLCVVGDPDQSIYSWRNADIRNILSFQSDYPKAKTITLEENYRSTKTILEVAENLISTNTERVKKKIWTNRRQGDPVVVSEEYNEEEEAKFVVKEIQNLIHLQDYSLNDIAVMYRVNAQSRVLESACLRYGLPYQVVAGQKFYQRKEVKDIIAYLRIISNPHDDLSISRVINVPSRRIGRKTTDELSRISEEANVSIYTSIENLVNHKAGSEAYVKCSQFTTRSMRELERFYDLVRELNAVSHSMNLLDLVDYILEKTGYKSHLMDDVDHGEDRWANIEEFRLATQDFLDFAMPNALDLFLENVSLVSDIDGLEDESDSITLITLHQAKGLEFSVVFMIGMEEGIIPHVRSMDNPREIEEERRLCYVGVTRAKERLYLSRAFRRGFRGGVYHKGRDGGAHPSAPSRFLADIPCEIVKFLSHDISRVKVDEVHDDVTRKVLLGPLYDSDLDNTYRKSHVSRVNSEQSTELKLSTGDKVKHETFGDGIVMSSVSSGEDFEVTVAFKGGHGVKRLLSSVARLEKLH